MSGLTGAAGASGTAGKTGSSGDQPEKDPRYHLLKTDVIYADVSDETQQKIMEIAKNAYGKYILNPTKGTDRKDARKELERDIERTSRRELAQYIKRELDNEYGTLWHVVYGRDFAAYVTHEKMNYFHFTLEDAHILTWKHGE